MTINIGLAPSASRTPNSCVRCATPYANTPYKPIAISTTQGGEERQQERRETLGRRSLAHALLKRSHVVDGQLWIGSTDDAADHFGNRVNGTRRSDHNVRRRDQSVCVRDVDRWSGSS